MAGVLRKIGRWLLGRSGRTPKAPNILVGGHRGVAIGSTKKPDLSPENIAKWRNLAVGEVKEFVLEQVPLFVHSTNVVMAQYFFEEQKMLVEFGAGGKKKASYLYSNVTPHEAVSFATAESKGSWCWSVLRIRGTKNGHKKPYRRIS